MRAHFLEFELPALGTHFGISDKEDFQFRIGENYGPNVAAFEDHSSFSPNRTLFLDKLCPDGGIGREFTRKHRDIGFPNFTRDIGAVQKNISTGIKSDIRLRQQFVDTVGVVPVVIAAANEQCKRTIHRASIQMDVPEPRGDLLRRRTLTRGRRAVDRDNNTVLAQALIVTSNE